MMPEAERKNNLDSKKDHWSATEYIQSFILVSPKKALQDKQRKNRGS
jgi:hypothetical protein